MRIKLQSMVRMAPGRDAGNWGFALAGLVVSSLWVWMAVRTTRFLQFVTRGVIPHTKRTVWLLKILALIVGAGGVASALAELGVPWFLAVVPAAGIVLVSAGENVSDIVPLKPEQTPSFHDSAWRQYWRLRRAYMRSSLGFGAAVLLFFLLTIFGGVMPHFIRLALVAVCAVGFVVFVILLNVQQWRLVYWPCPRCGHSFRGAGLRLWLPLPKHCVYCGLAKQAATGS